MAKCLISLARRARFGHTTFAFGEKNGHLRRRSPEYAAVRYHILESLHNFDFILCFNTLRYAAIFTRTASVVLPRKQQFGAMVRMARLTKCVVDAAEKQSSDYIIWDDELPGFGLRVFRSGKRSYLRHRERCHREECPVHGVRKPADRVKTRRLSEEEYRVLGKILRAAATEDRFKLVEPIIRFLMLTGCRRSECVKLKWTEVDGENSCLRLRDTKEGASVRPIGLPALDVLEAQEVGEPGKVVFRGTEEGKPLIGFPKLWRKLFKGTSLQDVTPHVLRHSFASVGNDLGFTEATIAALMGHSKGTVTSRYIHAIDASLVMAADTVAGYINGLLQGVEFKRTSYALDRAAREATLARLFSQPEAKMDVDAAPRIAA